MRKCIVHGEAFVSESKIPQGAVRIDVKEAFKIIANSETTGNHHVIDVKEGVEFFEKDGVLYLKNEVETDVRCMLTERHDNITLPVGEWEIGIQQEYDPFEARTRRVAD